MHNAQLCGKADEEEKRETGPQPGSTASEFEKRSASS